MSNNIKSKKLVIVLISLLFQFTILHTSYAQEVSDVFPAVVFLDGNKGIENIKVDGEEVEVWIKNPQKESPQPYYKTFSGTGFLVQYESDLYLVTAQHVAMSIPFDTKVTLRGLKNEPITFLLSQLTKQQPLEWIYHHEADVAVVPISPPPNFVAAIKAVGFDQLSTQETAPALDKFLTTIGFPLKLGISSKFSPIVKTSHPASDFFSYRRFDNNVETTFFVLEDPSVAGFSGAPVFNLPTIHMGGMTVYQGAFECVGLVHGTFNDPSGGKFAAIVPSKYIVETIKLANKK